jgi:DNA primase
LKEGLSVAMVDLEAGEDPDSYLKKQGGNEFRKKLQAARPALSVFIEEILEAHHEDPESRARAIEQILAKLKLLDSAVERRLYLQELEKRTGLDLNFLPSGGKAAGVRKSHPHAASSYSNYPTMPFKKLSSEIKNQNLLLLILALKAEFRNKIGKEGTDVFFSDISRKSLADLFLKLDKNVVSSQQAMEILALTEEQKKIVTEIYCQDICALEEGTEQIFKDLCDKLRLEPKNKRHNELTRLIFEAEKKGDKASRAAYLAEKKELENSSKTLP